MNTNVLYKVSDYHLNFTCPGCKYDHGVTVEGASRGPIWGWNGSMDKPTITPSIMCYGMKRLTDEDIARVQAGHIHEPVRMNCHSFVTDGRIQFLGDCDHELAGTTVDLPVQPEGI